jgi:ABC-type protease/lipase transport system fused ATPase/permease subunit
MATRSDKAWLRPLLRPLAGEDVKAMSLFVNLLALATPAFVLQVYDRVVFYADFSTLGDGVAS